MISDESQMKMLRLTFRYNPNMPKAIELVNPNKFLLSLRPVEEFRLTPIIPIRKKDLLDYKR